MFFVFFLTAVSARADEKPSNCYDAGFTTIIKDKAEAKLLSGQHIFMSLSAKNLDYYWQGSMPGHSWIVPSDSKNNPYKIMAQTETHGDEACDAPYPFGNSLHINGAITEIRAFEFDVKGTITAGYYPENTFEEKSGMFTFSRKDHPDYWLMTSVPSVQSPENAFKDAAIFLTNDTKAIFDKEKSVRHILSIKNKCRSNK